MEMHIRSLAFHSLIYVWYLGPFFGGESPNLADCAILPKLKKFRAGFMDHIPGAQPPFALSACTSCLTSYLYFFLIVDDCSATCLDSHPEINAYIDSMLAVPAIAAWYARSKK